MEDGSHPCALSPCKAVGKRASVGLAGDRCPQKHQPTLANEYRDVLHMDGRGKKMVGGGAALSRQHSLCCIISCISACHMFLKAAIRKVLAMFSYDINQVMVTSVSDHGVGVSSQPESLLITHQGLTHFPFQSVDEPEDAETFHHTYILMNMSFS